MRRWDEGPGKLFPAKRVGALLRTRKRAHYTNRRVGGSSPRPTTRTSGFLADSCPGQGAPDQRALRAVCAFAGAGRKGRDGIPALPPMPRLLKRQEEKLCSVDFDSLRFPQRGCARRCNVSVNFTIEIDCQTSTAGTVGLGSYIQNGSVDINILFR